MFDQEIAGSNGIYGHYTWSSFLNVQKRLGRQQIALYPLPSHLWLNHVRCSGLEPLKTSLKEAGITVNSFHPMRHQYSLFEDPDSLRGSSSMQYYRRCTDVASALGCTTLCLRPGGSLLDGDHQRDWERMVHNLRELTTYAKSHGVRLCIQTVRPDEGVLMTTCTELEHLLNVVPDLGAALDTVSISQAGESIPQWFACFGENIRHICFWDGRNGGGRIWGMGVYPSLLYARQLLESGYDGPLSICGFTQRYDENPEEADAENLARVQRLFLSFREGV